jgi:hypothetical protein
MVVLLSAKGNQVAGIEEKQAFVCPNEYGPTFQVANGVQRSLFGECVCVRHNVQQCAYQK